MLSVLLSSVTNFPIGQHPHTIRLIKGVFNSKPLKVKFCKNVKVITKLPNSEQSYKGKVKTHNYINRQNQSTTGKL